MSGASRQQATTTKAPPSGSDEPAEPLRPQAPVDAQSGSGLDGVNRFKMGFGVKVVVYPQTLERRYRSALAWLIRRINPKFREAPLPSRLLDH